LVCTSCLSAPSLISSPDWFHEETKARKHNQFVYSGQGLRRALSILFDNTAVWVVLVATGFGIGVVGGWLDILVAWCGTQNNELLHHVAQEYISGSQTSE
jgi:hypothetical protein